MNRGELFRKVIKTYQWIKENKIKTQRELENIDFSAMETLKEGREELTKFLKELTILLGGGDVYTARLSVGYLANAIWGVIYSGSSNRRGQLMICINKYGLNYGFIVGREQGDLTLIERVKEKLTSQLIDEIRNKGYQCIQRIGNNDNPELNTLFQESASLNEIQSGWKPGSCFLKYLNDDEINDETLKTIKEDLELLYPLMVQVNEENEPDLGSGFSLELLRRVFQQEDPIERCHSIEEEIKPIFDPMMERIYERIPELKSKSYLKYLNLKGMVSGLRRGDTNYSKETIGSYYWCNFRERGTERSLPSVYLDGKGEQLRVEFIIYFHHKKEAKKAKQLLIQDKVNFLRVLHNLPERFCGMIGDFSSENMEEVFNEFIQSNYSSFSIVSEYNWEESIISSSNLENRILDDLKSLLPVMNYLIETIKKLREIGKGTLDPGPGILDGDKVNFNIKHILDYFAKSEYTYDPELVQRLHIGLHAIRKKHFVILTGISGTGKTNIVKLYANSVYNLPVKETNDYLRIIPVRPDWNDEKSLLGYYNPLLNRYQKTAFLEFILEASQSNLPHFICLDEMNLARVEYYFSDFLSALESGYPIRLHDQTGALDGVPPEFILPDNLFIIGTVNVDETTHTISDKVLDRASTLEFNEVDVDGFIQKSEGAAQNQQGAYLLKNLYSILAKNQLHFGYRTMKEFFDALVFNQKQESPMDEIRLLDALVLQKILPKIRGDHRIEILLQELIDFLSISLSNEARSVSRLKHMLEELRLFGATQFWR